MPKSYHFKICSEKAGYEVKPVNRLHLDLMNLEKKILEITGYSVRVSVPALLLLEGPDGSIINIFPSGRLLLRNFETETEAERIVDLLAAVLYK